MSTKLFVGNLSFNTTENDLQDAFAAHGTVVETNLMMDRMSGRPRGFGFVTMSTPEEAQKAIEALKELRERIGDAGLKALSGLPQLQELILINTRVSDPAVAEFQKALPKCKILR